MNNYWKLKSAVLTRQLAMSQLNTEAQKVEAAFAEAMKAEGLNPASTYTFSDADESAVEVTP